MKRSEPSRRLFVSTRRRQSKPLLFDLVRPHGASKGERDRDRGTRSRLILQLHYDLGEHMTLQVGGGPSRLSGGTEWSFACG
jgi:hypothetical protein